MATYPNTGSNLGSTTRTALSTQIIILVNNEPVGAIQRFDINAIRTVTRIKEIGTDGTIEIAPQSSAEYSLSVERIIFDGLSLPEAFARGFMNINSQRIPFDIVVIDQYTGSGDDAIIRTFHNCWFKSLRTPYGADNYIITENADIEVEYMSILRGGEAVALSQGIGGSRQVNNIQIDDVELQADSGTRRGALDFAGLISAAY